MKEPVIELKQVTKYYDQKCAVDDLNLTIYRGEIFGLLGPNGAGKSTTILMILGLSEPSGGQITVLGHHSSTEPISVKRKVGYLPDNVGFYEERSGLENLTYTAMLNGFSKKEAKCQAHRLLKQVGLEAVANEKTGTYSRGMKQRLGLADVLIKRPEIIILDEPTLGIDPQGVQELLQLIKNLSKENKMTVILSSHYLHQVQQICDRVGIFVKGKLLAEGDVKELAQKCLTIEGLTIEANVSPVTLPLLDKIRHMPNVLSVEQKDNQKLFIKSSTDICAELAQMLVQSNVSLHQLTIKDYGLDEIYHRYFKGEVEHDKNFSIPH